MARTQRNTYCEYCDENGTSDDPVRVHWFYSKFWVNDIGVQLHESCASTYTFRGGRGGLEPARDKHVAKVSRRIPGGGLRF